MPSSATPINRDPEHTMERWHYRAVRSHILFFIAVVLGLMLAWRLRSVLELVYVSALFAVVLMPAVQQVMRIKIGRWHPSRLVAILGLVLSVLVLLGAFFALALPPLLHDMQHFVTDLPRHVAQLVDRIKRLPIAGKLNVDSLAQRSENIAGTAVQYVITSAPLWLRHVGDLLAGAVLCLYFMLEGEFAYIYFLSLFPAESRERIAKTLATADQRMSKWLLGQGSLMLIIGLTSTIVFGLLHVRYFFMLGMLMGLLNIVPIVGDAIGILLAGSVAALDSWTKMAGVFIFYAIYTQVENAFLTPRIMRSSVNLEGLAVVIALLAGWDLAGVVGALVAVPTAALIAVLMQEFLVQKDAEDVELLQQVMVQKGVAVEEAKEAASAAVVKEAAIKEVVEAAAAASAAKDTAQAEERESAKAEASGDAEKARTAAASAETAKAEARDAEAAGAAAGARADTDMRS